MKKFKYSLQKFLSPMDGKRVNHFCASKTVSDAARSQDILPQLLWQFCQMKMSSSFILFISRFQVRDLSTDRCVFWTSCRPQRRLCSTLLGQCKHSSPRSVNYCPRPPACLRVMKSKKRDSAGRLSMPRRPRTRTEPNNDATPLFLSL